MKIYIPNILPINIKDKMDELTKITRPIERQIVELTSSEFGKMIINNDTTYMIESTFNNDYELIKNYQYNDTDNYVDLLVDKTQYSQVPMISQYPVKFILVNKTEYSYKKPKSKLSLIIECVKEDKDFMTTSMMPIDFYFIYENDKLDLQDSFIREEINVFLSCLK